MKIVEFIPGLNAASGVSAFCVETSNCLAHEGQSISLVYMDNDSYRPSHEVKLVRSPSLSGIDFRPDVAHIHSLWACCVVRSMWWCVKNKVPFVVSPHGSLMPRVFTKGRLKKWIFWHFFLKVFVKRAAAIHCTGEAEKGAVRKLLGKHCPPIVIVPLGVYLPDLQEKPKSSMKTVLFLGRLGEEKGLVELLEAWSQVKRNGWQLVLAGPDWEGHRQVLLDKCHTLGLPYVLNKRCVADGNAIVFAGAAEAKLKDELYRNADIFVLPSPMENFSHVVVEALSFGLPVIATKGTPWRELESEHCGRWIDPGVAPLAAALSQMMAMSDDERAAMGASGRKLAVGKYQWDKIAADLINVYRGVNKDV